MSGEDFFDEIEEDEDDWPGDEFGRWDQNACGMQMAFHCRLAGTEFCDFECPYRDAS